MSIKDLARGSEKNQQLLETLCEMQEKGEDFPCPRCGHNLMHPTLLVNKLSRYAKVYICISCGWDEVAREANPMPMSEWGMIKGFAQQ